MTKKLVFSLFFFLIFIGSAFATIELVSNTSQCLTDCKAVLHVTPNPLANTIDIPSKPNLAFKIEFEKAVKATNILDYKIQLCQNITTEKTFPIYDVIKTIVPDVNGETHIEETLKFSHNETKNFIEYNCKDFFGSKIEPLKEYWIEITGKRKPVLGENSTDWILTYNNQKLSQWAWWNSNWLNKKPIEICANTDLNAGQLIWIKDINFNDFNVQADFADLRIINELTYTELNRKVEGTSTSIDGNIFFAINQPIPNGMCDQNFYVYYNNASATAPAINNAWNYEDFERYTNGQPAPFGFWPTTNLTIENSVVKNGSLAMDRNSNTESYGRFGTLSIPNYDTNLGNRTIDYNLWYRTTHLTNTYVGFGTNDWIGYLIFNGGNITTNNTTAVGSYSADTWYNLSFRYTWGAATYDVCVFDTTSQIGCATGEAKSSGTAGIPLYLDIALGASAPDYSYVDDFLYFVPYQTNISLGTTETESADLNSPIITDFNISTTNAIGWSAISPSIDVNLKCIDSDSTYLLYTITNNDVNYYSDTNLSGSLIQINIPTNASTNIIRATCYDKNRHSDSDINTVRLATACFTLMDEETGNVFDLGNVEGLYAKSLDQNYAYNFKAAGLTTRCYSSTSSTDTIRFDINYASGLQIFREFTPSLFSDTNIPICMAKPQQFYEVLLTSSLQKNVLLINNNVQCYSLGTYTKYAYGDAVAESAFTIVAPYYLYLISGDSKTLLALIDGSKADTINLDILQFNIEREGVNIGKDGLEFKKISENVILIYYRNLANDNQQINIKIFDNTGTTLLNVNELTTPNDLNIMFDFSTYTLDANMLKITITAIKNNGTTSVLTKWFNTNGFVSSTIPEVAIISAILAMLVLVFGLTLVAKNIALGWFGIAMTVIALYILATAPAVWYIVFLEAITLICMLFIAIIYKEENAAVS